MVAHPNVSLVVGFKKPVSSHSLGAIHRKFKIRQDEKLSLINGYSIDIPKDKVDEYVASLPKSAAVMIDQPLFDKRDEPGLHPEFRVGDEFSDDLSAPEGPPHISRPAGLEELHAQGFTGKGTTIAVVDSGLSNHRDLKGRIKHFKNFSNPRNKNLVDLEGHGTHVTGIAAGDGKLVDGIAPEAEVVGLKIGDSVTEAIQAITWVVENKGKYDIDVLNLSLGVRQTKPFGEDPFAIATQAAIDAGVITIVASGNECTSTQCASTISTPGSLSDAITVGAYYDGGTNDDLSDDKMWGRSSNGPTAIGKLAKPDLVAPGAGVLAPKAKGSRLGRSRPNWKNYHLDSGSSMATPMVSGTAALLLQVDPDMTQAEMKEILKKTADPMDGPSKNAQGAGRLNLTEALKAAGAELEPNV